MIGGAGLDVDFSLESPQGVLLVSESCKADCVHTEQVPWLSGFSYSPALAGGSWVTTLPCLEKSSWSATQGHVCLYAQGGAHGGWGLQAML